MDVLYSGDNESLWFTDGLVFTDKAGRKARLVADCAGDFDIAFCDWLYAVYENDEHELVLLKRETDGWLKTVILKSKNGEMGVFGLRLIVSEGKLNILYGLNHNGKRLIIHQYPEGEPQVIGEAFDESFFVRRDEAGCVYAVYEAAEDMWVVCVCRLGVWSEPEEIIRDEQLKDIMFTGYREFCTVTEKEGALNFKSAQCEFEVLGSNPSIVRYNGEFVVLTEDNGKVSYTGISGRKYIIASQRVKNFFLRMKESGEYMLCSSCRGSLVRGSPRLFLIDGEKSPGEGVGDSVRVEMAKQSIKLETRLSALEKRISEIEKVLFSSCNPQ